MSRPFHLPIIPVVATAPHLQGKGEALAKKLQQPFLSREAALQYDFMLLITKTALQIYDKHLNKTWCVDFLSPEKQQRLKNISLEKEPLIRACKVKGKHPLKVVDPTAGWGMDAVILAKAGFEVTLIERNIIVAALLEDGLNRLMAAHPSPLSLKLYQDDAKHILPTLKADVIYCDPMHPPRKKSALVKAPMRLLQNLVGKDNSESDTEKLVTLAYQCASQRVVVKRPPKSPTLLAFKPTFQLKGERIRYDVYVKS